GLHSKLVGVLQVSDINKNKKFTIRTKQDVQGFDDLKETTFYTHLLIKQMANKAASLISEL
ncbi:outer membrane lipoprotein MapA, partial [Campylobacter jejuni]